MSKFGEFLSGGRGLAAMMKRPQKIILAEIREQGVRVLIAPR